MRLRQLMPGAARLAPSTVRLRPRRTARLAPRTVGSVPRTVWLVSATALALLLSACGAPDGGIRVEGPAPSALPWSGPTYMTDWYGRSWQHPTTVYPTAHVGLDGLKWHGWGSARPTASGVASDSTCLSGCTGGKVPSYRVKVVLSGLVRRGDVAYYSHAQLVPVHPPAPFWTLGNDAMDLDVPEK